MKLNLIKILLLIFLFICNNGNAKNFENKYSVSTSGIKIGEFIWTLNIKVYNYESKIDLKSSGIFSPLYSFRGKYKSRGIIKNDEYVAQEYKQYWKTKKKIKIVEMSFDNHITKIFQKPKEKELSRVNLNELAQYYDPITSFINILNGSKKSKTIDGRRIYLMEKVDLEDSEIITVKINNYKNIWADHKRNDLKKIEFFIDGFNFLPKEIKIYFKDRVFKLKKI